ncbi:hypothetical protein IAQ61_007969 [Plenodomus lingam]|uniref:Aminoglycoside phosphotransferase domain-containing protein n=1 Tax=Leptosphaeria maculans (strain JN3 / isolate v23.1.3 / race Av1-4-5-6-7-8) TaxID=985895 RepID=E5A0M8_LEPMJ|nr:hypothetical protein LEMA_P102190.1 [Plenodomus lingam JN3]KAH9867377.1 hypothetical protein IAQ61_007969 [Plenodomus lingam]CBX97088.1 hypothetical protein LEMA_P102190.1 [Plenodomus lingam JN3]
MAAREINTLADFDFHFHPTDRIRGLIDQTFGVPLPDEVEKKLDESRSTLNPLDIRELCRSCGWNDKHELGSSYISRLGVFHTRGNRGLWVMGNDWMIWDRTEEESGNDYMTHQFLQKHNPKNIPLLKTMAEFKDENGKYNFVVLSRARGVPLHNVWKKLSRKEKRGYAHQVAEMLRELRGFTAESPQRVDGSPIWDNIVAACGSRKHCINVGKTKEEWMKNMEEELREGISRQLLTKDKAVIEARLQEITHNFPDGAPYVLSHCDLNLGNILVHDGKVVAIIDWETAGYLPWWVEIFTSYYRSLSHADDELFDMVWKELGLSIEDLRKDIGAVISAYGRCPVEHTGRTHIWLRPPFCECKDKNSGGVIRAHEIDSEEKHYINYEARCLDYNGEYAW